MEKQLQQSKLSVATVHFFRTGSEKRRKITVVYRTPAQLAEKLHRKVIPSLGHVDVTGVTDPKNGLKWGQWNPQWAHWVFDNGRFETSVLLSALSGDGVK